MNAVEKFAKDLMLTSDRNPAFAPEKALRIAQSYVETSNPINWPKLPVGMVFYREIESYRTLTSEERGSIRSVKVKLVNGEMGTKSYVLRIKDLTKTYRFWQNVLGIIKRELKGKQ